MKRPHEHGIASNDHKPLLREPPGRGVRIGRIAGIDLRLDASLIIAILLVAFWLAAGTLPAIHPHWSVPLRWGVGVCAAVLLFASVLLHELGHSLVAKLYKLKVSSITLFIFGGAAQLVDRPRKPSAELLIALAGPFVSFIVGLGAVVAGSALSGLSISNAQTDPKAILSALGPLPTLLLWLGPLNILLALFNLLPGFPLDGGHVLRALLWAKHGERTRATRQAAGVGRFVGFGFIALGICMAVGMRVPFLGTGLINGVWLGLLGWFLAVVARQAYRSAAMRELLAHVPVSRVMYRSVSSVRPEESLTSLVDEHIMRSDAHCFPVADAAQHIEGVVCFDDVRTVPRERWDDVSVEQVMTRSEVLVAVEPEDSAVHALDLLERAHLEQVPVLDHGTLRGIVRRRDIAKWLALQSDASALV